VPALDEVTGVRTRGRHVLAIGIVVAAHVLHAQQEIPPDKVNLANAVRADLSRLSDLERSYFATNGEYTVDVKQLHFVATSGAAIAVSYASARTFSASASDIRLAPFLCFVIASSAGAGSPAEKPFCTDSRYGTAASALARAADEGADSAPAARPPASPSANARVSRPARSGRPAAKPTAATPGPPILTPREFAERLRNAVTSTRDSVVVIVQFAVKGARYDPSRGLLEVAVERVPMPAVERPASDSCAPRPALACFTRPVFVCGTSGLSYIARDILRVPQARAPSPETLQSGLILEASFAIGRRDDTPGPALTLLALRLEANGEVLTRWEP
jgi:hypothetical protein